MPTYIGPIYQVAAPSLREDCQNECDDALPGRSFLRKINGLRNQQMFEDGPFSHFLDASYGSIYPALTRLTAESKVTCEAAHPSRS